MTRRFSPFDDVNVIAQIASMKEVDYKNTLVITAIVEVLVEKGLVTRKEILEKTKELETELYPIFE
ncbi:hypothetical protein [Aneurinibacillus tyrosinisolvens]|jgi:hypothetical protein|uniref:hypothetical protein n=1 Tax=Aneurinibacillus tyrosinisolvens TaxID=1443435 RepID=UPI00063F2995|nr:hypothetical protein [Aneurinibacillus tyrosinisolvens]